jgi:hypothetical protein
MTDYPYMGSHRIFHPLPRLTASGLGLIEVMIAASIGSIVVLGVITMISRQQAEMRWLMNKAEILEGKTSLLKTLDDEAICSWQFKDKEFNSAGVTTTNPSSTNLELTKIYQGPNDTSMVLATVGGNFPAANPFLIVDRIVVSDIKATGVSDQFAGNLSVYVSDPTASRKYKPIIVQRVFSTTASSPSVRKISACSLGSTASAPMAGDCAFVSASPTAPSLWGGGRPTNCTVPMMKPVFKADLPPSEYSKYHFVCYGHLAGYPASFWWPEESINAGYVPTGPCQADKKKVAIGPSDVSVPTGTACGTGESDYGGNQCEVACLSGFWVGQPCPKSATPVFDTGG